MTKLVEIEIAGTVWLYARLSNGKLVALYPSPQLPK